MSTDWPNIPLNVTLTRVTTNQGEPYAELRVEDKDACLRLLTVRLDAAEFFALVSGSYVTADGEIPPSRILPRAGKVREHAVIPHPKEFTHVPGREPSEAMQAFADQSKAEGGWESASWTRHNFGWQLIGYRWVDRDASLSAHLPEED